MLNITELELDELLTMWDLYPKRTGLPVHRMDLTSNGVPQDIPVKIARGGKLKPTEMISVALRPNLRVIYGTLSSEEFEALGIWVNLNQAVLLQYWNEEIDTGDVLEQLKKL